MAEIGLTAPLTALRRLSPFDGLRNVLHHSDRFWWCITFQQHQTRAISATPIRAHSRAMSDSEESMSLPSDDKIEQTLRDAVANLFASGKSEEITVKRVRTIAEEKLSLPQDFLKGQDWKARSNTIIHNEVVSWRSKSCCTSLGITDHLHSGPA